MFPSKFFSIDRKKKNSNIEIRAVHDNKDSKKTNPEAKYDTKTCQFKNQEIKRRPKYHKDGYSSRAPEENELTQKYWPKISRGG